MRDSLENIENYIQGGMSREDRLSFEEKMKKDPELRKKVEQFGLMDQALELAIEEDLRKELGEMNSQRKGESRPKVRKLRFQWAAAAAIILLLASLTWILIDPSSQADQFAETSYLEYNYPALRSEGDGLPYGEGFALLGDDSRQEAIQWFENYTAENPDDAEALFILADLLYRDDRDEEARRTLLSVIESGSVLWKEKAQWNYVNISARDDWNDTAEDLLQEMVKDDSHSYHSRAIQLKKMLDD